MLLDYEFYDGSSEPGLEQAYKAQVMLFEEEGLAVPFEVVTNIISSRYAWTQLDNAEYVYHVTDRKYVADILSYGLKRSDGQRQTSIMSQVGTGIFFCVLLKYHLDDDVALVGLEEPAVIQIEKQGPDEPGRSYLA